MWEIFIIILIVFVFCLYYIDFSRIRIDSNYKLKDKNILHITDFKDGYAYAIIKHYSFEDDCYLVKVDDEYRQIYNHSKDHLYPVCYNSFFENGEYKYKLFYHGLIKMFDYNKEYLYDENLQDLNLPYDTFDLYALNPHGIDSGYILVGVKSYKDDEQIVKYGVIDCNLKEVIKTSYDSIEYMGNKIFSATIDDMTVALSLKQ